VDVDLDDAGVGRDQQLFEAAIRRRRIAFDHHRQLEGGTGEFDGGNQVEGLIEAFGGRQENIEAAGARFDAQGGAWHFNRLGAAGGLGPCSGCFMKIGQWLGGGEGVKLRSGLHLVFIDRRD